MVSEPHAQVIRSEIICLQDDVHSLYAYARDIVLLGMVQSCNLVQAHVVFVCPQTGLVMMMPINESERVK